MRIHSITTSCNYRANKPYCNNAVSQLSIKMGAGRDAERIRNGAEFVPDVDKIDAYGCSDEKLELLALYFHRCGPKTVRIACERTKFLFWEDKEKTDIGSERLYSAVLKAKQRKLEISEKIKELTEKEASGMASSYERDYLKEMRTELEKMNNCADNRCSEWYIDKTEYKEEEEENPWDYMKEF